MTPETFKYVTLFLITTLATLITLHAFFDRRVKSKRDSTHIGVTLIVTWTAIIYAIYTTIEVLLMKGEI